MGEFIDEVHIDQTQSVSIGNTDVDGRAVIYIHERLGILAVAFRGTETGTWVPGMSETGTNWDTNYDKELIDCNLGENACGHLHKGFSDLYQALQDDVVQAFNRAIAAHNPQKLLVTGHSLGAALATLFAYEVAATTIRAELMQVVTFGSPRVGDPAFARQYRSVVKHTISVVAKCFYSDPGIM